MAGDADFEKSTNLGDACYHMVRIGNVTTVTRQWLNGDSPDPLCEKEELKPDEIPTELLETYEVLSSGGTPTAT